MPESIAVTNGLNKLRVGDEGFLITSLIERCPKVMMLRELVINAAEAAVHDPQSDCRIEIRATWVDGVRKLAIWNTGFGLNAEELYRMCDIASSIRKQTGMDKNFGMGAKVASLPSNKFGLRYMSCRDGKVHEVVLGKREGIYGRLLRRDPLNGHITDVLDITAQTAEAGRPLDRDWTEVVLLGNDASQDTVSDPYDGDPKVPTRWVASYLYERFFDFKGVQILLGPGLHAQTGLRRMQFLRERLPRSFGRYEAVALADGVIIHYAYNPGEATLESAQMRGGLVSDLAGGSVIYQREHYDLRRGTGWAIEAPSHGIPFAARHISAHVELPDEAAVRPDGYRQFLRYQSGPQDQVKIADFASLVREHRPQWLIDLINDQMPDSAMMRDVSEHLQQPLRELGVKRHRRARAVVKLVLPNAPPADPTPKVKRESNLASDPVATTGPKPLVPPPTGGEEAGRMIEDVERTPEIILLRSRTEIEDRGLMQRAARYNPASHQLFINMLYPAVARMMTVLEVKFAGEAPTVILRSLAKEFAEHGLVARIGRALVFALSKQEAAEGWSENEKRQVLSSEALTLAGDDFYDSIPSAREALGQRIAAQLEAATTTV